MLIRQMFDLVKKSRRGPNEAGPSQPDAKILTLYKLVIKYVIVVYIDIKIICNSFGCICGAFYDL